MSLKKHIGMALGLAAMAEAMQVQESSMYEPRYKSPIGVPKPRKHLGTSVRVNVRTEPKIKVNDPCPCGSGKKSKKCCYPKF